MLKRLFWTFSDLFEFDDFENFRFGFLLTMTHIFNRRFLGGHLKKRGMGCFVVRLGQDTNVGNFALVYFEKRQFLKILFV